MATSLLLAFLLASSPVFAGPRVLVFRNNCPYDLWPALTAVQNQGNYPGPQGWHLPPGEVVSTLITAPWSGRAWTRRECDREGNKCISGYDKESGSTGIIPVEGSQGTGNMVEWNLLTDDDSNPDSYDISYIRGFNVPLSVAAEKSDCPVIQCTNDINAGCPEKQMQQISRDGEIVGCMSACAAGFNRPDGTEDVPNCCSGHFDDPAACLQVVSEGKYDARDFFHNGCPLALSWPYEHLQKSHSDASKSTCNQAKNNGYLVDFCGNAEGAAELIKKYLKGDVAGGETSKETGGENAKTVETVTVIPTGEPSPETGETGRNSTDPTITGNPAETGPTGSLDATGAKTTGAESTGLPTRPGDKDEHKEDEDGEEGPKGPGGNSTTSALEGSGTAGPTGSNSTTASISLDLSGSSTPTATGSTPSPTGSLSSSTADEETTSTDTNNSTIWIGLGVGAAILVVLILVCVVVCMRRNQTQQTQEETQTGTRPLLNHQSSSSDSDSSGSDSERPPPRSKK